MSGKRHKLTTPGQHCMGWRAIVTNTRKQTRTQSCKTKVQSTQEKLFTEPQASEGLHLSHSLPSIPISSGL